MLAVDCQDGTLGFFWAFPALSSLTKVLVSKLKLFHYRDYCWLHQCAEDLSAKNNPRTYNTHLQTSSVFLLHGDVDIGFHGGQKSTQYRDEQSCVFQRLGALHLIKRALCLIQKQIGTQI